MIDKEILCDGACACGRVKVCLKGQANWSGVCHCERCKKASGSAFMAFISFPIEDIEWIAGRPVFHHSSALARRWFCPACGSPVGMQDETDSDFYFCRSFITQSKRDNQENALYNDADDDCLADCDAIPKKEI